MIKYLPESWKLNYRLAQRNIRDRQTGVHARFPKNQKLESKWPKQISIVQPIRHGKNFENKVQNLQLAANRIGGVLIEPDSIFSFWHLVGSPSKRNGFLPSRNLVNGQLIPQYGGGLCQISGIIYHLALKADLPIHERHRHSVDIYEEHERFTPPGSDATVVYGRKDLRFENSFPFPITFYFEIKDAQLTASLCSLEPIQPIDIQFVVRGNEDETHVKVIKVKNGNEMLLREETYPKLKRN